MVGVGLQTEESLHRLVAELALSLVAGGLLVLSGWYFDIPTLKSVLPQLGTMKPNTAVGLLLIGITLFLKRPTGELQRSVGLKRLALFLAVVICALGLLTLSQMLFGWDFGIDQFLFRDSASATITSFPGRMSPITAANFFLLGIALLLLDVETRGGRRPSNLLAVAVMANSMFALLGYLYGVDTLYRIAAYSSIALHTAVLFVVACVGIVFSRPRSRLVNRIAGDNIASSINRRLLPAALLLPPLFGWLRWQGELADFYSTAFGLALFTATNSVIFVVLAWWSSRSLQRIHDHRIAVLQSNDWTQAMLDSADATVISTDVNGLIRTINARTAQTLGYEPAELIGKVTPAVIHDAKEVAARAEALTQELGWHVEPGFEVFVVKARMGVTDQNDWTYVRKDGTRFPVRLSVTPLVDADGRLNGFLGVGNDITLLKEAEGKLRAQAQTDTLTGLPNRSQLNDKLARAIAHSERGGEPMALIFIDMDNFKAMNDDFGHAGGDLALKEVARRLSSVLRSTDTVARLAGDEFVVLVESIKQAGDAALVARKLMAAMDAPFAIGSQPVALSCSYGIALRRPGETDADALLHRADSALYRVKASGRGGLEVDE